MKKIIFVFLCALSLTSLLGQKAKKSSSSPAVDKFARLDTAFQRMLNDWKAPGFAVAVVEKDKIVYAKGFGYRDVENKLPMTANTVLAIGSCTKAFTCSLIGLQQKNNKIEWDKPVKDYYPELKFFNNDMTNQITVRDIMTHRTGLPRHDYSWYLNPTSRDSFMKRVQYLEPTYPPRQKWQYNNFMFALQGVIVEKLTQKSWEKNIEEQIFKPLGMTSSFFSVKDFDKKADAAKAYMTQNDSIIKKMDYYNIDAMGPAGSINSSVTDMAQWVKMWINGGKYDGKEILPNAYISEAMSSHMIVSGGLPTKEIPDVHLSNYGFGWFLASYKGHYRVEHGGNIDGFSASTSFFPTDSIGIIVLVNQNSSALPSIVRNTVADIMLKIPYFDWHNDRYKTYLNSKKEADSIAVKAVSNRKMGTQLSHKLEDYTGIYKSDGYGDFIVDLQKDSLFLSVKHNRMWLERYHYDIFATHNAKEKIDTSSRGGVRVQFTTDLSGNIGEMHIFGLEASLSKPLVFIRKELPKPLTLEQLKKYVGEFELMGAPVKTYLKEDKTLYVVVPGQPEYELDYVGNNKFNFAKVAGFAVQFEMGADEVTSLTFLQPHGNYTANKKTKK
jgi:CubicO group peptidase (beta-lactamase class C family)